jgi:two-component system nitrate/nitrite response regulator NarL
MAYWIYNPKAWDFFQASEWCAFNKMLRINTIEKENPSMIRVLIAHPSRFVCDSLRNALDNIDDVFVVGGATTKEELHFLLPHSNVVILDTDLERVNTLEAIHEIHLTHPQTKVLIMGLEENPEIIIRYVEGGAFGYILRNESIDDVVGKLEAVQDEKAIVSPTVVAAMMNRLAYLANIESPTVFIEARQSQLEDLTSREEEVLSLISAGCTNREIASRLVIEYGTVKNHVHNILDKLDVRNRHEAASLFEMQGQPLAGATL